MIHFPVNLPAARISSEALMIEAARCWWSARNAGVAAMPRLYALLCSKDWPMLAPVFDSLMRLIEESLNRPFEIGRTAEVSVDERLLAGLMRETPSFATPLASALYSLRVVLEQGR